MILSYRWLLDYLPNKELEVDTIAHILTSVGLEVEAVEKVEAVKGSMEGLVVGEVLTCRPHPNADKLKITSVRIDAGDPLTIVCGAPNVAAGQKVIVAPVGATVHPTTGAPFAIKKAKIRGEESHGMICAGDEIGLNADHSGILVLPENATVGMAAADYYQLPGPDYAIHIGLTPNRFDAASHLGAARDILAYLDHETGQSRRVHMPDHRVPEVSGNCPIKITVHEPEACPRYMGLLLQNVTVGNSPEWLQRRLLAIGQRSVNNVVDITNYVLHETGQPLHAFDAAMMEGREIHVRFLPEGAAFTTLDNTERKLQGTDLMICDAQKPLAMAGVFGGLHSGVTEQTQTVFLESAWFQPDTIRKTSLHHGLRTDAATHFEKGVDMDMVPFALMRAAHLLLNLCGAEIDGGLADEWLVKKQIPPVTFSLNDVQLLSGKYFRREEVVGILTSLGFIVLQSGENNLTVQPPSHVQAPMQLADIVEEIIRIDGLNKIAIPEKLNISLLPAAKDDRALRNRLADMLCGMGFYEMLTNSITNSAYYPEAEGLVRLINSLSSELDVLRPSMLETSLEVLAYNSNRKQSDLRFFEFGKVYRQKEVGHYLEAHQLALAVTGRLAQKSWQGKEITADFYYLKGVVDTLLESAGLDKIKEKVTESGQVQWLHKKEILAEAFEVPQEKLKQLDVRQPVYFAVIHWDTVARMAAANKVRYREVPKFPAVQRDLALVVDESVSYEALATATEKAKPEFLQSYRLFDVFKSDKLGAGKKSMAVNFLFQADRTLTDAETDKAMQQLTEAYQKQLGAQVRE